MALLNMLLVLLLAIPMYICATGSIPIALSLMLKGMTPGAAFVLLMADSAINVASMLVIDKAFGRKQTLIYISTIVVGALGFGLLMDYLLPAEWFMPMVQQVTGGMECHDKPASWWQIACAALFVLLLVRALYYRLFGKVVRNSRQCDESSCTCSAPESDSGVQSLLLKVNGMRCHHCAQNVKDALASLPFVASVEIDLPAGKVQVTAKQGEVLDEAIIRNEIEKAGYSVENSVSLAVSE